MADETYNGWSNVETWRVQLHLANDEQTAATVARESGSYVREAAGTDDERFRQYLRRKLAGWLRAYVSARVVPEVEAVADTWGQFASDTLEAALGRVDWEQLAGHWLEQEATP
jgi:hypothetical protein